MSVRCRGSCRRTVATLLGDRTMADPEEARAGEESRGPRTVDRRRREEDQFDPTDLIVLQVLTCRRLKGEEPTPAKYAGMGEAGEPGDVPKLGPGSWRTVFAPTESLLDDLWRAVVFSADGIPQKA